MQQHENFDIVLAQTCAKAFSQACGVGCTVSDAGGRVISEYGYGCTACGICRRAGRKPEDCVSAHVYGMTEAARFGGKYIYFCPMGLTCFVSPIFGDEILAAMLTVGPFLMVTPQDFLTFEVDEQLKLEENARELVSRELENVPYISADKVSQMSTLLFMAVGFLNNVSDTNRMLERQGSIAMQGQITSYIQQIKAADTPVPYPMDTERKLMQSLRHGDQAEANRLLNDLLGHIFLVSGGDTAQMKVRIFELLAVMCRAAIDAGADQEQTLQTNQRYYLELNQIRDFDQLCRWMTQVVRTVMGSIFNFDGIRHVNVIHQSIQYVSTHYSQRITLEELAGRVYLSPSYFGRIFKQETGESFTGYLNRIRIERSKELLVQPNIRLTDVAQLVGFEEQSYFCRVFKKLVGMTPGAYREAKIRVNPK